MQRQAFFSMRVVQVTVAVMVAAMALASAQDQTTPKQLSWKDRAKLDYQRRYEKYILHKKDADEDNVIVGDGGSESNAIPLGNRGSLPIAPPPSTRPPPPVTRPPPPATRPPPPPTRPPPPPPTRSPPPPPPPPTRPPPPPTRPPTPSTPVFRPSTTTTTAPPPPPPPSTTTTRRPPPPPPPPTPAFRPPPPPSTTTPRPTTASSRRPAEVTDAVPQLGVRSGFPGGAAVPLSADRPTGGSASSGAASAGAQQGTVSGTFSRPAAAAPSASGSGFASSSATAFSSGGATGGSSSSNAGTLSPSGTAAGTFSFNVGGGSSASGSTTAVNKSPVALLGKVVQGIVRPITSILPAPLGPKGSNPGLVGGLVSGIFEELDGGLRAIYPGTLWCGAGNVARSEDDVGVFQSTDRCCRQHDNCPDSIAAGASKHGLRNTGTFTRSHCDCDELFYKCLKADRKSIVSVKVGTTYFNLLRPRCFRAATPCPANARSSANCTATYRWFNNRIF